MPASVCARPRAARAATAAVALLLSLAGAALGRPQAAPSQPLLDVVVRETSSAVGSVHAAVESLGGTVVRDIALVHATAARIPAPAVGALAAVPGVLEITPDVPLTLQSEGWGSYDPASTVGSAYNTTLMTGAQDYWRAGYTGSGVDVAVIDSGVVPVDGLSAPGKVLNGPDLSFESQAANLAHKDTYGHGTHISGLIAGRDTEALGGAYAGDTTHFIGMAPDARVVSVKVADSHGMTDVSQVLAAIDWVVQHRADPGMNIRVLNLSFGTDSYQSYTLDPLSYAVETAWHAGIVVVASTGNSGWKTGVMDPADNPYVLAVGAADTLSTVTQSDDSVASFSAGGDGYRNPDLVAPGIHMVSLRDPGSYIDTAFPSARVAQRFFKGSGTSQATAVVAGAAALLLSQHPLLSPDQVKALLTSSAKPLSGAPTTLQGAGELNLDGALYAVPPVAAQAWAPSTGTGSLEGARGSVHLTWSGVTLSGETDIFGNPVNTAALASAVSSPGGAWTGGVFNGAVWTGDGFVGDTWATAPWTSNSWSSNSWSSNGWSSNGWSSNGWSSNGWSSNGWSSNGWSSNGWSSNSWSSNGWS